MKIWFHRAIGIALPSLLCSALLLNAQIRPDASGDLRIGISAGGTYNLHPGILSGRRGFEDPTNPVESTSEKLMGYSVGIIAGYTVSDLFALSAQLSYAAHPGRQTDRLTSPILVIVPNTNDVAEVDQVLDQQADVRYDLLELDVLGKARLLKMGNVGAGIAGGFSAGYPITLTDNLTRRLVSPEGVTFVNTQGIPTRENGRVLVYADNKERRDESPIRLGLHGGIFCDVPLWGAVRLTPGIYYDYGLTNVLPETDWKMHAAMFQLDLTMAL